MFGYLRQKDVILTLTKYEFKLRYRGTIFGVAWSLFAPFLLAIVLYLVFRNIFAFVENFALYVLIGIFVFRFFSVATSVGMHSIISKSHIVTKTNLRREIIPLTTTVSYSISSFLEIMIILPIILFFGVKVGPSILIIPLVHASYLIFVFGMNLILSALMVYFRDLNQIWEIFLNVLFFLSPIVYPKSIIPPEYLSIYMLNPITKFIELYRGILLRDEFYIDEFLIATLISVMVFLLGQIVFARMQKRFGEVL
uniref:Transport permease protein n=1 Tax=candidate division WOR-3 bacterium TaxID=2052148 RepID=A0A7V3ZY72_UNCW3